MPFPISKGSVRFNCWPIKSLFTRGPWTLEACTYLFIPATLETRRNNSAVKLWIVLNETLFPFLHLLPSRTLRCSRSNCNLVLSACLENASVYSRGQRQKKLQSLARNCRGDNETGTGFTLLPPLFLLYRVSLVYAECGESYTVVRSLT